MVILTHWRETHRWNCIISDFELSLWGYCTATYRCRGCWWRMKSIAEVPWLVCGWDESRRGWGGGRGEGWGERGIKRWTADRSADQRLAHLRRHLHTQVLLTAARRRWRVEMIHVFSVYWYQVLILQSPLFFRVSIAVLSAVRRSYWSGVVFNVRLCLLQGLPKRWL